MTQPTKPMSACPVCNEPELALPRRRFLQSVAAVSLAGFALPATAAEPSPKSTPETAVKALYDLLTEPQRKVVCFDWDHKDEQRGLLRTHVSNNWHITKPTIAGDFFTKEQKDIIHDIFKSLFQPEWYPKLVKQLKDDNGGKPWGTAQNIAIFGKPGAGKFEFVMTGRHMTVRADGNSEAHVALGGPIFHGHAAESFNEKPNHPGNVFWHQALEANKVYQMLSGKQRKQALVATSPHEAEVAFRGEAGPFPGLPIAEMTKDQREVVAGVLKSLLAPYREEDQKEIIACLEKQGGLSQCSLAFYEDGDVGKDEVWDNWRIEGPSFVWYFRGDPHVHIWINVADSPKVPLNAKG